MECVFIWLGGVESNAGANEGMIRVAARGPIRRGTHAMTQGRITRMHQGSDGIGRSRWLRGAVALIAVIAAGLTQANYAAAFPTTAEVVISNAGAILAGSVATFPAGTPANGHPSNFITGGATGLDANTGAAISPFNLHTYVANSLASNVLGFAPGDSGNSSPEIVIGGGSTGLNTPDGVAFDIDGDIYVANTLGSSGICGGASGSVTIYDAEANGDVLPIGSIAGGTNTTLCGPVGIAVDSFDDCFDTSGPKIWVVNSFAGFLTAYCPSITGFGNVFPVSLAGVFPGPDYLALGDAGTEAYVTTPNDNAIDFWDISGCGFFDFSCGSLDGSIFGRRTRLRHPQGIAATLDDDLFVANTFGNSFAEFLEGFIGNVRPFSLVRGATSKLNQPVGVALAPEED